VFCENSTAEGVNLTEGDSPHSGSFEPEAEAANSAEEVEDIHLFFQCINGAVARPSGPHALAQDEGQHAANHDDDRYLLADRAHVQTFIHRAKIAAGMTLSASHQMLPVIPAPIMPTMKSAMRKMT
jgi:hypothetical protein